jgi:hypothetical protein
MKNSLTDEQRKDIALAKRSGITSKALGKIYNRTSIYITFISTSYEKELANKQDKEDKNDLVRCKCPYCEKIYYLSRKAEKYTGSEPWYKFCEYKPGSNCQGLNLSINNQRSGGR